MEFRLLESLDPMRGSVRGLEGDAGVRVVVMHPRGTRIAANGMAPAFHSPTGRLLNRGVVEARNRMEAIPLCFSAIGDTRRRARITRRSWRQWELTQSSRTFKNRPVVRKARDRRGSPDPTARLRMLRFAINDNCSRKIESHRGFFYEDAEDPCEHPQPADDSVVLVLAGAG